MMLYLVSWNGILFQLQAYWESSYLMSNILHFCTNICSVKKNNVKYKGNLIIIELLNSKYLEIYTFFYDSTGYW